MRLVWAAIVFQVRLTVRAPATMQIFVTAPLLTAIFMAMTDHARTHVLAPYAVVAPTLMSMWTMALFTAGNIITEERNQGTLEGLVASPASLALLVGARLTAVTMVSLATFGEAVLVAGLGFGRWITIDHPAVFAVCLAMTAMATAATASMLSPIFVLAPSARIIQNTVSYPLYLLGGALVPVSTLPGWLQPVTRVIFLSWCADLVRDCLSAAPVGGLARRLAVVLVLTIAGYAGGHLLLRRVLWRVRQLGSLSRI